MCTSSLLLLLLLLLLQLSIDVPFFSMDLGLSSCVKVQGSAFPRYKAYWSCGMKVTGSSMCTPGDCVVFLCRCMNALLRHMLSCGTEIAFPLGIG
jgi:hypothetical protein